MNLNNKPTGIASSIPKGLAIAGVAALALTLTGVMIIALMVDKEVLEESKIGYAVMVLLIVTSYISSTIAWKKIKHRRTVICLLAGGVYYGILLSITALFFGGQYSAVGETALLVLCGSFLSIILGLNPRRRENYRKMKKVYR